MSNQGAIREFLQDYITLTKKGSDIISILEYVGKHFKADRAYIIELDQEKRVFNNTFEWTRKGVTAEIDNLQNIPFDGLEVWFDAFYQKGEFYISSLSDDYTPDSATYKILEPQGIESLMAAPFMVEGKLCGFLGVDNPKRDTDDLLLLSLISSAIYSDIILTRNANKKLSDRMNIIKSLSEIYTAVFSISLESKTFIEISATDIVHSIIGESGNAEEKLMYFCNNIVTPEFRSEMLEFTDLSTIEDRLKDKKIISKQFLSNIGIKENVDNEANWTQCSFIEGERGDDGHLKSVIFATQYIHDAKIKEIEINKQLKKSNDELLYLLDQEKKNSSVIDVLSNAYFALLLVDIKTNTLSIIRGQDKDKYFSSKNDARTALNRVIEEVVSDDYQTSMRVFVDFDFISSRIDGNAINEFEYQTKKGPWHRCSVFPVERDDKGNISKIIVGFRDITQEKKALTIQENLILALSMSYENVYVVNLDTKLSTSYRMSSDIRKNYGSKFAVGDFKENLAQYLETEVIKEDQYLFEPIKDVYQVDKLLRKEKTYYFNYRILRDGAIKYYQCQLVKPEIDGNEFVIAFKDVDEEKKKELDQQQRLSNALVKLAETNNNLRLESKISSSLSFEYHSLFLVRADVGEISIYRTDGIGMSEELVKSLVNFKKYDLVIKEYISKFVIPEDQERMYKSSSLESLLLNVKESGFYKQSFRRFLNGEILYYEMNVSKIISDGKTIFIIGMRDVDKEMRETLLMTKEMESQREIIKGLSSDYYSILLVDPINDSVLTNRALGIAGEDIRDMFDRIGSWSAGINEYASTVSESYKDEFLNKLSNEYLINHSSDYSFIYEKDLSSGKKYLQAKIAYVKTDINKYVVVVGTRNVDEMIQKEKQQELALKAAYDAAEAANRAKTDFLSNMSHDIRTPMNGIIGMTAIAAAHLDDSERVRDCLGKITQASKHLLSLINEVLDMSKIESGKVDLVEEEFNISDLIDNLITMNMSLIEAHNHKLNVIINNVEHEDVIGDSFRIQKIFTNLMSNAVKFTPNGGNITLTITEYPNKQAKVGCYEFVFEDDGIGIAPEFINRIFDPFSRAEDGRVSKIQGTGLGMTISRNIVRMMGGDIRVESEINKGSKFTVTIYLRLQETTQALYEKFVDLPILIADDDEITLQSCSMMLTDIGMKIDCVSNGADAIVKVVEHHLVNNDYYACILDWKMPDMDGIATTKAIRKAVGQDVPIIIISAYDWAGIEQEARAAGANAFISKPLFRSRLIRTFKSLIEDEDDSKIDFPLSSKFNNDFSGKRVLLVEDNDLNREIALEMLEMTGLTVDQAQDGIQAVDKIVENEDGYYDLIFMDIQMPRMNGYDATRAIRAMGRNYCKNIPIIAVTANAFAEDVHAAKTVGMNEHIAKPFDAEKLLATLEKYLHSDKQ